MDTETDRKLASKSSKSKNHGKEFKRNANANNGMMEGTDGDDGLAGLETASTMDETEERDQATKLDWDKVTFSFSFRFPSFAWTWTWVFSLIFRDEKWKRMRWNGLMKLKSQGKLEPQSDFKSNSSCPFHHVIICTCCMCCASGIEGWRASVIQNGIRSKICPSNTLRS